MNSPFERPVRVLRALVAALVLVLVAALAACSTTPDERIQTIYALKKEGGEQSLEQIRGYLKDPDPEVRAAAVFQLALAGAPDARQVALDALQDDAGFVRSTAATALASFPGDAVVDALSSRVLEDADWHVRQRAAESLGQIGGEAAGEALTDALNDPIPDVRKAAVAGVSKLGPQQATQTLARMVRDDPEWEIRVRAAEALGRTGGDDAKAALQAAQDDPNEFVRAAAAHALEVLAAGGAGAAVPKEAPSEERNAAP